VNFVIEPLFTTNTWQKSWREQATQCPSQPQNQPNEECMRSTHPRKGRD